MAGFLGVSLLFGVLLGVAEGSQRRGARPLPIPKAGAVDRVVIQGRPDDAKVVVRDAKRIGRLVDFVAARNTGWRKPWDTFPTPRYALVLEKGEDPVLVLWVGPGWLGGREVQGDVSDNRLRSLSEKD